MIITAKKRNPGTSYSKSENPNIIRVDISDTDYEVWPTAGNWDTPDCRVNGHPDLRIKAAYLSAFASATEMGLSQGDARERAEEAADNKHAEIVQDAEIMAGAVAAAHTIINRRARQIAFSGPDRRTS